ncbi:MAG TPA: ABC-2 family transporter protein [Verrucomicrobiae bacterium]|nr:ABC-2 family transporter protein [Verrucomicrobiae bacterium]
MPESSAPFGRYASIYAALWRNSVVREMQFKTNFILWIIVELLWFALQLTFISVIYSHTDHIGDWTKWEVVILMGTSNFIQQLFTSVFLSNLVQLSELIRTGKLDFMLLLPINTRFLISLRQVDLGGFINAGCAIAVISYAGHRLHLSPSAAEISGYALMILASLLIHYSLMLILSSSSFWTVRAQGIVWGYYNLFNIARLPDAAFRGAFKAFFTYALPMLLVANVPAKLVTRKLASPAEMLLLFVMSAVLFAVSELVWRWSVRRYTSASS